MWEPKVYPPDSPVLRWEISNVESHVHVSCIDSNVHLGGSGFASSIETAKVKALAELNERFLVNQLCADELARKHWGLDFDESCSGFAVGYSRSKTILRAILEGCERWTLSKWIDDHLEIPKNQLQLSSEASRYIRSLFPDFSEYSLEVPVLLENRLLKIQIAITLGWSETGVFAGYGSKLSHEAALEHAWVETLRNFVIFKNQPEQDHFPYNRIYFFGKNKLKASEAIEKATFKDWPSPTLKFLKAKKFGELWLARSMFDGWEPWQRRGETRFLY